MDQKVIDTALRLALKGNDLPSFRHLIACHPEALRRGSRCPWLFDAIRAGHLEFVKYLIEEANVGIDELSYNDPWVGSTPLESSVGYRQREITFWLLDKGAAVNRVVDGSCRCQPLVTAATTNDLELAKRLVELGADVNAVGFNGWNALMAPTCHPVVADYLRSVGAVDLRDVTPPDLDTGHNEILGFMQDYAGEEDSWGELLDWKKTFSGSPAITLYCRGSGAESDYLLLFTVGLSDTPLAEPSLKHGYGLELMTFLPEGWRLDRESMEDPQWNWPMAMLDSVGRQIHERGRQVRLYEKRDMSKAVWSIEMNGDPPQPLGPTTALCGTLLLGTDSCLLSDFRSVVVDTVIPIYSEEADFIRREGNYEPLLRRFRALDIERPINPKRLNAVSDWPSDRIEVT